MAHAPGEAVLDEGGRVALVGPGPVLGDGYRTEALGGAGLDLRLELPRAHAVARAPGLAVLDPDRGEARRAGRALGPDRDDAVALSREEVDLLLIAGRAHSVAQGPGGRGRRRAGGAGGGQRRAGGAGGGQRRAGAGGGQRGRLDEGGGLGRGGGRVGGGGEARAQRERRLRLVPVLVPVFVLGAGVLGGAGESQRAARLSLAHEDSPGLGGSSDEAEGLAVGGGAEGGGVLDREALTLVGDEHDLLLAVLVRAALDLGPADEGVGVALRLGRGRDEGFLVGDSWRDRGSWGRRAGLAGARAGGAEGTQ